MRNTRRIFLKMAAFVVVGSISLTSCGTRKSLIKTHLEAVTVTEAASRSQSHFQLNTSFYGDVLTGVLDADTSETDSATFESNGIKLKLKTSKGKNGKTKIDFKAEAKPVARSALRYTDSTTITVKKVDALKIDQNSKIVQTRPYWLTGLYLLVTIIVLLLIVWAYKKFRSWKKQI